MTSVRFRWDIGFKKPRPILRGSPLYLKLPVSCNVSFWWSSRASLVLNFFSQQSLLQRKKTPACWRILKRNWQLSRTQDAAANSGKLSVLPHACSVSLTSVVHWHWKREYTFCPWLCFIHRDTCINRCGIVKCTMKNYSKSSIHLKILLTCLR